MTGLAVLQVAHVVLAVVAVGTNLSFPLWIRLAERDGSALAPTLRAVRAIDRAVTIPAYLLTALTGLALAVAARIDLLTPWIAASAGLLVLLMILGAALYRPVSRARLAASEAGAADPAYRRAARRAELLDAAILGSALAILWLMVVRPV